MNEARTIRFLAYSALKQANNVKADAIAALDALVSGQFERIASGEDPGTVMTSASATNKSFSFSVISGRSTAEIAELAYEAVCLLNSSTDDQLATLGQKQSAWGIVALR